MIKVNNLRLDNYIIDIDFNDNKMYGLFALDKKVISNFFLMIAGINNSKGSVFYNDENIYDNMKYFKNRIYLDCQHEYFQTIKPLNMRNAIYSQFNKLIDAEVLGKHLQVLDVRGECEITSVYKLTPCGNTLVNLSVLLASNNDLLINNPTINITHEKDITYLLSELQKLKSMRILGLNNLTHFQGKLDELYLFTPFNEVIKVNPETDTFYLIDKNNAFLSLFDAKVENKMIVKSLTMDELKYCVRNKINYQKINIYELENYI